MMRDELFLVKYTTQHNLTMIVLSLMLPYFKLHAIVFDFYPLLIYVDLL